MRRLIEVIWWAAYLSAAVYAGWWMRGKADEVDTEEEEEE